MTWTTRARALALVAWLSACGGDDGDESPIDLSPYDGGGTRPDAGDGADAGDAGDAARDAGDLDADAARDSDVDASEASIIDATAGDAGDAGDGAVMKSGPQVAILAPLEIQNPVEGGALTGPKVTVRCTASSPPPLAAIDPTKVSVSLVDASNKVLTSVLANPAGAADTYMADVSLDMAPTGPITLRCVALDTTVGVPNQGIAEVHTFYDGGPTITFSNVADDSIVARGSGMGVDLNLRFKVAPTPLLTAGDVGADVAQVQLLVNDRIVALNPPVGGEYSYAVDFVDKMFDNARPVTSVKFEVIATDMRTGRPATSTKRVTLRVDGDGPSIMFTSPMNGSIVGGTVGIQAMISDALAGVAEGTANVSAVILGPMGMSYNCQLRPVAVDTYHCNFEAGVFGGALDVTITIRALDTLANESLASLTLRLDNTPPWVSLDPPTLREINSSDQVSRAFDPLGASPMEGEVIDYNARFRALVWERGNEKGGATEEWLAGVRDDTVKFFAQDDEAVPLLIDTDDDAGNLCDAVNAGNDLASEVPFVIALAPVATGGSLRPTDPTEMMTVAPTITGLAPISGAEPDVRCKGSEMTYVLSHLEGMSVPVVYAQGAVQSGVGCTGVSFGIGSKGGWLCVAAAAKDKAGSEGNLGVSVPLRVCRRVDPGDCKRPDGTDAAIGEILTPPAGLTCTDGCTVPTAWRDWGRVPTRIIERLF